MATVSWSLVLSRPSLFSERTVLSLFRQRAAAVGLALRLVHRPERNTDFPFLRTLLRNANLKRFQQCAGWTTAPRRGWTRAFAPCSVAFFSTVPPGFPRNSLHTPPQQRDGFSSDSTVAGIELRIVATNKIILVPNLRALSFVFIW